MKYRDIAKRVLPPVVLDGLKSIAFKGVWLKGDYLSWEDAVSASTGYDQREILEKTKESLLKVKNGEAVYERDTVLFDTIEYTYPVLAGLMWVAAQHRGILNVLDFGGSLGSTYYQNRAFLSGLPEVRWNVIEQPAHVNIGKRYFEDSILRFYRTIDDCLAESRPNVILASGVLQYIEKPYELLTKLLDQPIDNLIIDRTPFWSGPRDRLCVQNTPSVIYEASYPIWVLSIHKFSNYLLKYPGGEFEVMTEFESLDKLKSPVPTVWMGMILKKGGM